MAIFIMEYTLLITWMMVIWAVEQGLKPHTRNMGWRTLKKKY